MSQETITPRVLPCGGLVRLDYGSADPGEWTLSRVALVGGAPARLETLYQGPAQRVPQTGRLGALYVDTGEGGLPLDPATTYVWTISTSTGAASASAIPAASLTLEFFDYSEFILRFLQAGVQNITLPGLAQFRARPRVINAMPLTGAPTLPTISVAEDLAQQVDQGIGHTVNSDYSRNEFSINEIVHRRYRVAILCSSVEEREFYKTLVISLFKGMLTAIMGELGLSVRYSWQSVSSQQVDDPPGFYYSEIGLQFDGNFQTLLTTSYPSFDADDADLTMSGLAL